MEIKENTKPWKERMAKRITFTVAKNCQLAYHDVAGSILLWPKQFSDTSAKVNVGSEELPYIVESVLHLYLLGIKKVNINVVSEDIWKEGDDLLFEKQLLILADEIIDNNLYKVHSCSIFNENNTVYQHAFSICKMHNAKIKANNYYWNKLYQKLELERERDRFKKNKKQIQVIC